MNAAHSSSTDVPPAESYLSCPLVTSGDPWTTRVTAREERSGWRGRKKNRQKQKREGMKKGERCSEGKRNTRGGGGAKG